VSAVNLLRGLGDGALELIAPEHCLVCGARRGRTPWAPTLAGAAPGLRLWHAPHLCRACLDAWREPVHLGVVAGLPLRSPLREHASLVRAIGAWKYRGLCGLVHPFASLLTAALAVTWAASGPYALVPVPLHPARRRARGFDQTRQLTVLAGRAADQPVLGDVLARVRATRQQASEAPDGDDRRRNVAGAFRARPPRDGELRRLVIVDDLATTGATLAAASDAATAAGWEVVGLVALGQAARLVGRPGLDTPPSACVASARDRRLPDAAFGLTSPGPRPTGGIMKKASLETFDPRRRRVLMRVDFNVPLDQNRTISDDTRIRASLPSINHVVGRGGSLVLMSHLGRPKGEIKAEYSLRPVADRLAELVEVPVKFAVDTVGPDAQAKFARLQPGEILLVENLRFNAGETKNEPGFAAALAKFGDVYVNDAFGTAHRAHASTVGAALHFKQRFAGLLMQKELAYLGGLLQAPPRPFTAILGGAKVEGKVEVIRNLLEKVDHLLLGGGMIFTFFKVMGLNIGNSLLDEGSLDVAAAILEQAKSARAKLVLPTDIVVSTDFSDTGQRKEVLVTDIPDGWQGLDIGSRTVAAFQETVARSRAIFWNGPMGVFEIPVFATGTRVLGQAIADATAKGATSVVGGGDSVAALNQLGLADGISHISTGGGASLEFMGGLELPGVTALSDV